MPGVTVMTIINSKENVHTDESTFFLLLIPRAKTYMLKMAGLLTCSLSDSLPIRKTKSD